MKNLKIFWAIIIAALFVFSISSSAYANECGICGKKIYIGSQCASCTFNRFVNKLEHPCKVCGQNIFFGKICRSCKEKQADLKKRDAISAEKDAKVENNKVYAEVAEKKPSRGAKMWNSITASTNNFYRRIFGTNKHD